MPRQRRIGGMMTKSSDIGQMLTSTSSSGAWISILDSGINRVGILFQHDTLVNDFLEGWDVLQ